MKEYCKPRIMLMGEFSAGKSSLCNLLIGQKSLLERVTATQLPPVMLSYGTDAPYREDIEGKTHPIALDRLMDIPLKETRLVRIFLESDVLELCDLIDMPGISDPNMPPEVWERMIHLADSVLWCTHANQAWRQSEVGVWTNMPEKLRERSFLLLTRFDKIINDKDRLRLLKRVSKEVDGLFAKFFPISLTQAMAADDNYSKWVSSGAEAFMDAFIDLVKSPVEVQKEAANLEQLEQEEICVSEPVTNKEERIIVPVLEIADMPKVEKNTIVPRRVIASKNQRSRRPRVNALKANEITNKLLNNDNKTLSDFDVLNNLRSDLVSDNVKIG